MGTGIARSKQASKQASKQEKNPEIRVGSLHLEQNRFCGDVGGFSGRGNDREFFGFRSSGVPTPDMCTLGAEQCSGGEAPSIAGKKTHTKIN